MMEKMENIVFDRNYEEDEPDPLAQAIDVYKRQVQCSPRKWLFGLRWSCFQLCPRLHGTGGSKSPSGKLFRA